jgi:transaldolase
MVIKLYADGASLEDMRALHQTGKVSGFTTNPTLMRKAGVTDYKAFAKEAIKEFPRLPISFEVFADNEQDMIAQAIQISNWGPDVYVKIPVTFTNGNYTTNVIRALTQVGIKLNITAILTIYQIFRVREALDPNVTAVVSIFAGRIADTGRNPEYTMQMAVDIFSGYPKVEVLWASTREVYNITTAENCGCDIITVSPDILTKYHSMKYKDLTELSLDTVKMFYDDAKDAGYSV